MMRRLDLVVLLGAAVLGTVLASAPAAAERGWRRYVNDRFGTAADVPADFRRGPAPTNDDGRSFTSPDGRATISVFGSNGPITVSGSFAAYTADLERQARADGLSITYRSSGPDALALSGTRDGRITYIRVVAGCPDRSVAHEVHMEYDVADRARLDPVVARVARSLTPGRQGFCR